MFFDTHVPSAAAARLDTGLPALLLRTDRNPFHHGTLAAIRSLGRAGVPVHAILEGRGNPSSRSRYLHRGHPWAPPAARPAALLSHLRTIGERVGRQALLVPLDDAGAIFVAEHADALAPHFAFPHQDPDVPRGVADKSLLLDACARYGIQCPPSRTPASTGDVDEAARDWGLPLIAKWARPWLRGPGLRSTTLVRTPAEAHRLFAASRDRVRDPDGEAGPLILQRRIPPGGGDWFFQGYFDESLDCLFGGVGRKHLAHPPQAGHTVSGEWVDNAELGRLAVRIVRLLGCRGLVDLDFRLDPDGGGYHLLDFNPRLGAQFRLFTDENGLDQIRVLHLAQSGRRVPAVRPAFGRNLLVENHYLQQSAARSLRALPRYAVPKTRLPLPRPPFPKPATLRPLREADELAWYAGDDLPPFLAMGRQSVLRAVGRLRTR
ncbi:ATP-grasp domain-containing protein [Actinomadura sp. KC216]|uniref:carboxylate--amine ligase n=1 Tax=Actinomadura sp. KC216 TaxID=2530370 RepID=UPI00104A9E1F|nr:ATP-grasp domain-containing protein [Actinomadura sp. KC216]TDB73596.1 ATP-grasp domain-containing protein [Actinomadura sp. KC216]